MADKRVKVFSPYNYGIKYRIPGKNPFQKYQYVPGAGGLQEPIYVVTKIAPSFFASITNCWYFDVREDGKVTFLKCDSEIGIYNEKYGERYNTEMTYVNTKSQIIYIKKNINKDDYRWKDDRTVEVFCKQQIISDIVVLLNNEYYNEYCNIIVNNSSFDITFNQEIDEADYIAIIIYPISTITGYFNDLFIFKENKDLEIINTSNDQKIFIKNELGNIDYRYLILNSQNKICNLNLYNVEPLYIEFDKINDIGKIYAYTPKDNMETFIIQFGIDEENIKWYLNNIKYNIDKEDIEWNPNNDFSVEITHNLNGYVNYILDRNDDREMIKRIKRIDKNKIKIEFNRIEYNPHVFSLVLFKISEDEE